MMTCVCLCALFTLLWARIAATIANKASARTLGRAVGGIMVLTGVLVMVIENNPGGMGFFPPYLFGNKVK